MKTTSRKARTIASRTIQALLMLGAVEQPWLLFAHRIFDTRTQRYFVGHSGSLSIGLHTDTPSKSRSITNTPAHHHLAALGEYSSDIANPREVYQHIRVTS